MHDQQDNNQLTPAWLLEAAPNCLLALSEQSVIEYIPEANCQLIPGAVDYCNSMFYWRSGYIPVFDLNQLINQSPLQSNRLAVVVYQEHPELPPKYIALKLNKEVEKITVSDEDVTDWPNDYPVEIEPLVEALFMRSTQLLSVISIADLCNQGFRDYMQQLRS